jgi:nicotinamidase-related amidase
MVTAKNALIIVDIQHYFLKEAPSELPDKIIRYLQSVNYNEVVFTVFKNTSDSNFVNSLKWDKCTSKEDTALPEAFSGYIHEDNIFTRNTYSAFKATGMHQYLQSRGIQRLILCGVDTAACVLATAFEAFDLGYHIKVEYGLTYSSAELEGAAHGIISKCLSSRD